MNRLQHAAPTIAHQTTPARMGGSHHRTIIGAQQHRQAIGHHDGAGELMSGCHAGIGLMAISQGGVQRRDLTAVNLLEKNAAYTGGAGQQGAVGINMCFGITDVVAEVHAVIGNA